MSEQKKKRLWQRLEADIKAGLVILALVLVGYIAGRLTVRAAEPAGTWPPVDKPLAAALVRGEPELVRVEYLGTFVATYYCCERYPHICGTGDGLTATGVAVEPGIVAVEPGIVAVDPAVIPLGSTVVIDGAEYIAADTGGLIKGQRVDIAVPTHAEALALGVREVEVWVMAA